ncbi:hypothetical protein C1645_810492 [Glomus cerebriforme]|uniref:Crinkler family protein n=1 Tax=Glomus cerebriforme TaxID=658196 RepID=A0A397S1K8_9GLOM|nr:hypothetical protein C1645_810492 [Glomus cerebriforme]
MAGGYTENIKLKTLQSRSYDIKKENNIIQELGGKKLSPVDDIGDIFKYNSKNIRIIIQPPLFSANQGPTDISHVIGYLPRQGGLGGTLQPFNLRVKSTNEGININDPSISKRFDIIGSLIQDLLEKYVILVQAPPFSGKTLLAQILEDALVTTPEFSNYRVIRISLLWESDFNWNTFGEKWKNIVGISWGEWIDQCSLIPSILIIDEAQLIYEKDKEKIDGNNKESADAFWMIVKGVLQGIANIYIIMFAAYRHRGSHNIGFSTSVILQDSHCKSLVDINFIPNELKLYVVKFCSNYIRNLDKQSILNFYKYIQIVTEGHAGLVHHILMSTRDAMRKQIDTNCLTWKDIFKYLNSESFNSSIYANCRAVPQVSALSPLQRKICEDIYKRGKICYINSNNDMVHLVKSGILILKNNSNLTFAAPLLKRSFFQQNYRSTNSTDTTPTDLHHFIEKIFTAMCNEINGNILRNMLGFGSDGKFLEQTWQKEFYRIGTQILGRNHFLSCEIGSVFGYEGKVDFYVDKLDWAIELLKDGENMEEHKVSFEPLRGEYKEIVKYAKKIAIIDIRNIGIIDTHKETKNVQKMKEDFIYVSCSKDFNAFKIESLGKETVIISFQN